MLDRQGTHVLHTSENGVEILSYNGRGERVGSLKCESRQDAVRKLESLTGRRVQFKPMQTTGSELVEIQPAPSDVEPADD